MSGFLFAQNHTFKSDQPSFAYLQFVYFLLYTIPVSEYVTIDLLILLLMGIWTHLYMYDNI